MDPRRPNKSKSAPTLSKKKSELPAHATSAPPLSTDELKQLKEEVSTLINAVKQIIDEAFMNTDYYDNGKKDKLSVKIIDKNDFLHYEKVIMLLEKISEHAQSQLNTSILESRASKDRKTSQLLILKDLLHDLLESYNERPRNFSSLTWQDVFENMKHHEENRIVGPQQPSQKHEEWKREQVEKSDELSLILSETKQTLSNLKEQLEAVKNDRKNHRCINAGKLIVKIDKWIETLSYISNSQKNSSIVSPMHVTMMNDLLGTISDTLAKKPTSYAPNNKMFRDQQIESGARKNNAETYQHILDKNKSRIGDLQVKLDDIVSEKKPSLRK